MTPQQRIDLAVRAVYELGFVVDVARPDPARNLFVVTIVEHKPARPRYGGGIHPRTACSVFEVVSGGIGCSYSVDRWTFAEPGGDL